MIKVSGHSKCRKRIVPRPKTTVLECVEFQKLGVEFQKLCVEFQAPVSFLSFWVAQAYSCTEGTGDSCSVRSSTGA